MFFLGMFWYVLLAHLTASVYEMFARHPSSNWGNNPSILAAISACNTTFPLREARTISTQNARSAQTPIASKYLTGKHDMVFHHPCFFSCVILTKSTKTNHRNVLNAEEILPLLSQTPARPTTTQMNVHLHVPLLLAAPALLHKGTSNRDQSFTTMGN